MVDFKTLAHDENFYKGSFSQQHWKLFYKWLEGSVIILLLCAIQFKLNGPMTKLPQFSLILWSVRVTLKHSLIHYRVFGSNGYFQVIAGPFNDRLTLAVARELERPFGGWTPPFRENFYFY